ncbi:Oidioi.mRNA.OKI2018_I69.PAR.g9815.t2.cds [Oikopleura dioica]|uniref:Oidioi.mRNA.OKI2018_I69.PAR.g9815.t2.cds n=1 Tax=Oikopleura dioica TaxID=34765 RepID=A0ABN7RR28_OIKDI|nr:Oidioi.mRNA.OKI2018_I69.PAR.g9815.t2.cds [Oikopleura dioica]
MSDEAPPPYPGPKKAEDTPADGSETSKTQTEEPFDNSKLPPPPPYSAVPGAEPTRPQIFIAGLSTPITISPDATRVQLSTEASPEQPEKIENYLLLSICSMIFCCFPLGVLATLLSCQVGILFQRGDYLHARIISQRARHVASMAIMIGCFMIFVDYFRRYNFGLDYGTNGMDGTMNPKIYATSDVDYTSSETPDINMDEIVAVPRGPAPVVPTPLTPES